MGLDAEVGGDGAGVLGGAGVAEGAAGGGEEGGVGDEAECIVGTAGAGLVYVLAFAMSVLEMGGEEALNDGVGERVDEGEERTWNAYRYGSLCRRRPRRRSVASPAAARRRDIVVD